MHLIVSSLQQNTLTYFHWRHKFTLLQKAYCPKPWASHIGHQVASYGCEVFEGSTAPRRPLLQDGPWASGDYNGERPCYCAPSRGSKQPGQLGFWTLAKHSGYRLVIVNRLNHESNLHGHFGNSTQTKSDRGSKLGLSGAPSRWPIVSNSLCMEDACISISYAVTPIN
jgi:hypothetical protein